MWKPIPGFSLYEASELGEIRSWRRKVCKWRNPRGPKRDTPVPMHPASDKLGYSRTTLISDAGERKVVTTHRLVAMAHLPPPMEGQTDVAHNDGNPANNRVDNLRWATHRENQMDMRRHGTMQDGEKCCTSKLTWEQVRYIRERVANGPRGTQRRLCEELGVSPPTICKIAKGHGWHE